MKFITDKLTSLFKRKPSKDEFVRRLQDPNFDKHVALSKNIPVGGVFIIIDTQNVSVDIYIASGMDKWVITYGTIQEKTLTNVEVENKLNELYKKVSPEKIKVIDHFNCLIFLDKK